MPPRASPALVVSFVVHAAVLGVWGVGGREGPREPVVAARSFAPGVLARIEVARSTSGRDVARAALVNAARASVRSHTLALGAFLLEASRIDAEERGIELDMAAAERGYAERLRALRVALAKSDVVRAVPEVFGDFKYYGQPGGLMASALAEGGGSCEQVSQVVAAAVYDAGRAKEIALRYYGGVMEDGAAHITPVAVKGAIEHDLMSGQPAAPGGARIAAEELVEVYARAHGLAPALAGAGRVAGAVGGSGSGQKEAAASAPARPTLSAGLPPNGDVYPGSLPLYAARAVRDPDEPGGFGDAVEGEQQAKNCAYFLRVAMLSPPSIEIETNAASGAVVAVEPRRVPTPQKLEREAMLLRSAETVALRASTEPLDRLMAWACLAALGEVASVDFALAGEHHVAAESARVHRLGREEGKKTLAAIAWTGDEGRRAARKLAEEYGGRSWILLTIEGGDRVVFDLAARGGREDWARISALGALVVWPRTREKTIGLVSSLPLSDQVDVMHEVFHAHDHMRPWVSSFELEGGPGADPDPTGFLAKYRVFRGLAWRLWEGQRPVEETLVALAREARAERVGASWEATLLDYLARNALGLYSRRAGAMEIVRLLKDAVDKNPEPSLDALRRSLAYLEAQAHLDMATLANAWRMK
jgi:hypothetical protein